jgi:O-antigen ligase
VISRGRLETGLDAVAPVLVAACVLAAAAGSSIQRDIVTTGGRARWVLIGLLLAFAFVRAALCLPDWRVPAKTAFVLVAFCGLALASVAWSVNPHATFVRTVGVGAVIAAVGALAGCVPSRPVLAERLLDGVLAAAAVVAFAGFVYWLIAPSHAAIPASTEYASRYQGIEQNPNTAALLLAIGMPLTLSRALRARSVAARAAFIVLILGFAASIAASGSRGGLLAAFVGLLTVAVLAPVRPRAKVAVALLVAGGLAVSAWATTIPKALPATPSTAAPASSASRNAEAVLPLRQEIGNPWWTHRSGDSRRSLFNTSVRFRAAEGTVHQALGRPLLGYGFGAEAWAFVNRYYAFNSQNPENGYLGLFLQLGVLGPLVFLVAVALCVVPAIRACLRPQRGDVSSLAAVGAVAAGLAAAISQSYFHGPGGIAFVAFWVSLLVAGVSGLRRVVQTA